MRKGIARTRQVSPSVIQVQPVGQPLRARFVFISTATHIQILVAIAVCLVVPGAWADNAKEAGEKIQLKAASEGPLQLTPAESGSASDTWKGLAEKYGFEVEFADDFEDRQLEMDLNVKTLRTALMLLAKLGGHTWEAVDEDTVRVHQGRNDGAEMKEGAMGDADKDDIRQRLRAKLKAKQAAEAGEQAKGHESGEGDENSEGGGGGGI